MKCRVRRNLKHTVALAGLACTLLSVGCMADGDGGMIVGLHAYGRNVETTVGKVSRENMSPTRSPEKNYREHNMSLGTSGTSFRHQGN